MSTHFPTRTPMKRYRHYPSISATVVFAMFFIGVLPIPAGGAIVMYNPAMGTLPQEQGFTFNQETSISPLPSVSGGILYQGLTSFPGQQWFERNDVPFNFDDGFTLEATLRVISSTYEPNAGGAGIQRSGYYMDATDELGRRLAIGIDSGGVTVNTDASLMMTNGITRVPFDTTDAFHHYRCVVDSGMETLFIDDMLIGSTPLGAAHYPGLAYRVYFGDGTGVGNSETQLSAFQYSVSTPEPTTMLLFGCGIAALGGTKRRRKGGNSLVSG